jgi:small subunit ribosomal protein S6
MRRYETFVIIDPDITQEQREPVLERVRELINQQDGFLVFEDVWGDRKLAYEIKKKGRGYYVRFDYCGLAPLVNEIERFFRIDDRALKYMTVVLDKAIDLEKIKEEKAAAESQREPEPAPAETSEETKPAAAETSEEAASEAPETPEEAKPAELVQEQAQVEQEEKVAPEPQAEEEAPASDTNESAEKTTPVEKKEEA